jgi:hypothetical protein
MSERSKRENKYGNNCQRRFEPSVHVESGGETAAN